MIRLEDKERKTLKFMIISVLIVILLSGVSVVFGYFIWNSNITLQHMLGTKALREFR